MEKFDFSGWATKNDLQCSDGRVIRHNAFRDNDGKLFRSFGIISMKSPKMFLATLYSRTEMKAFIATEHSTTRKMVSLLKFLLSMVTLKVCQFMQIS